MTPKVLENIPNTFLEIISSRGEMLYSGSSNQLVHFPSMPWASLGVNQEITMIECYRIHTNRDDEFLSDELTLSSYNDNGTVYYKARTADVLATDVILYYKINETLYTQPFKVCNYEYSLQFKHKSSLVFGYYTDLETDELAFHRSQVRDNPQSSLHQVVRRDGVSFVAESFIHEYVEIKAYMPYYAIRKLYQAQFMDSIVLRKGMRTYAIDKMTVEIGEGDTIREVTISILPTANIHHFEYKEENMAITQPDIHGVVLSNLNGLLSATITGGSGSFQIIWLKDGVQVGTGTSYDSQEIPGNYQAVVQDIQTGLNATDDHSIANLCENFAVGFVVESIIDSTNKLITLSANGTEPITYAWQYSADNDNFAALPTTTNVHEAEDTGFYKFTVTDTNGCTKTQTIQVTVANHTVEITRNSNTLTATVTGCQSATLQWYMNTGSGYTVMTGETSADLEVTENALYKVVANCSGAVAEAIYLVLDSASSSFMVLISKVYNDTGIQKAYAQVINAPSGVIGIEWYQRKTSGWVQVGSGDTIVITEIGFLKVIATDENGNAVIDEMPQVADPTRLTLYNKFVISASLENQFTITGFTVPNPAAQTVNDINAMWFATRGGIKLRFKDAVAGSLARDEFGIDYSNNKIYISSAIKIYQNEVIEFCNKYPYGT